MQADQLLVTAVIAIGVAAPAVLFIPRARQSPAFDRVLWLGTWFIAFLGEWFVVGNQSLPGLSGIVLGGIPVLEAIVGAAGGALILNGLLWGMDFFGQRREDLEEEELDAAEERPGANGDEPVNVANEAADSNPPM